MVDRGLTPIKIKAFNQALNITKYYKIMDTKTHICGSRFLNFWNAITGDKMASGYDYMQDRMASQMSRYYQKSEGSCLPDWLPNDRDMRNQYADIYNRREVVKFADPEVQDYYNCISEMSRTRLHQEATKRYLPGTSGWANDIKNQIEKNMQIRQIEMIRGQVMKTPTFKWIEDMENDRKRNDKTELNDELFKVKSFKLNQNN